MQTPASINRHPIHPMLVALGSNLVYRHGAGVEAPVEEEFRERHVG